MSATGYFGSCAALFAARGTSARPTSNINIIIYNYNNNKTFNKLFTSASTFTTMVTFGACVTSE